MDLVYIYPVPIRRKHLQARKGRGWLRFTLKLFNEGGLTFFFDYLLSELLSAFLLQGNTSCSGGTTNGTVLPSGYFSEDKECLQRYSSFIVQVFTEMTGISLNHLLHHTVLEPCSFTKMCSLLLPNPEKSVLFHLLDNSHRFSIEVESTHYRVFSWISKSCARQETEVSHKVFVNIARWVSPN